MPGQAITLRTVTDLIGIERGLALIHAETFAPVAPHPGEHAQQASSS